MFLGNC